jgi:hypothetical protein
MTSGLTESADLICPSCGYDLRSIPSERCPECGAPIDRTAMAISRIPWAHRKALGMVRAYWRTLILATFRIHKLGEEMNRPVDLHDASRFRWITVGIASVLPIALFVVAVCVNRGTGFLDLLASPSPYGTITIPRQPDLMLPFIVGITRLIVLPLSAIGWLAMVSGLAGYWFHPRAWPQWRRDRALALSWYACAPLVWLSISVAIWASGTMAAAAQSSGLLNQPSLKNLITLASAAGVFLTGAVALLSWLNLLRLLGFTLRPIMPRTVSMAIGWPVACCLSALVAFGIFPWIAGYIWLVIDSLR